MLPRPEPAVAAFFETLAHRCKRVDGSTSKRSPGLWLLDETITHENPFPRTFAFRKSFYALAGDARETSARVRDWLDSPSEGHVLNLFCNAPEAEAKRWVEYGYQLSWAFDLFARPVQTGESPPLPPDLVLSSVDSEERVDAINARDPEYPSSAATLADEQIHEVAILNGEEPLAKGEIVFHEDFVHVMGMVTVPEHRRRGLGRAILHALLAEAQRRGARSAVLNASLDAARFDFYPKLGFQPVTRCARLVPVGSYANG